MWQWRATSHSNSPWEGVALLSSTSVGNSPGSELRRQVGNYWKMLVPHPHSFSLVLWLAIKNVTALRRNPPHISVGESVCVRVFVFLYRHRCVYIHPYYRFARSHIEVSTPPPLALATKRVTGKQSPETHAPRPL